MGRESASHARSVAREADSFAVFYEAEVVQQVRCATLILGSRQAAQDVVHDVFVEVFRKWGRDMAEPGAYLQQAVVNRCRDAVRRTTVARR